MMIDFMNNIKTTPELLAIYESIQKDGISGGSSSNSNNHASHAQETMDIN
jgi:hypothetical protein